MRRTKILQYLFLLCCFIGTSFGDADAVSHRKRKYINNDARKKYGLHKKRKKKAVQPKFYGTVGMSYPAHIDISGRAKANDIDSGLSLSRPKKNPFYHVAIGMRSSFSDQIAFEVEGMFYRGKSFRSFTKGRVTMSDSSKLESISLFLNSYYMFDGWSGFHPFVGAGVGASYNNVSHIMFNPASIGAPEGRLVEKSKTSPAFQAILGISKNVSRSFDIQAKVKAMSLGKFVMYDSEGRFKAVALSGDVGIKYSFDHFKKIRSKSKRR